MTDFNSVVDATSTKIAFNTLNEENRTVSARELHERLGVGTKFTDWFCRLVEDCQFSAENGDFTLVSQKRETNNPKNPWTEITDYDITLDVAKEACMLCRNEKGKMFRRYFIEVEKEWNNSPMIQIIRQSKNPYETSLALAELFKKEKEEKALLIEQRIKAEEKNRLLTVERDTYSDMVDDVMQDDTTYTATEIAKDLGLPSAISLNKWLVDVGFMYKSGKSYLPYAKYSKQGYTSHKLFDTGHGFNVKTVKFTNKGKIWIAEKWKNKNKGK